MYLFQFYSAGHIQYTSVYSYLQWASSGFSTWTLVSFNIARLVTISHFLKNYNKLILIGIIFILISILVLTIPVAIFYNVNNQNCILLFWNQINKNALLLLNLFVFLFALFLYFLGSFVLLPLVGLIMIIRVIKIRKDSRKLISSANKQNSTKNIKKADIRLLISQILVSSFAMSFNFPMLITACLKTSTSTLYSILSKYCYFFYLILYSGPQLPLEPGARVPTNRFGPHPTNDLS